MTGRKRRRFLARLFGCRAGDHLWRRVYGDQILEYGGLYVCERSGCAGHTDSPVDSYIDPVQDEIDEFKRRLRDAG